MPTRTNKPPIHHKTDDIRVIENVSVSNDFSDTILKQINKTFSSSENILQQLEEGIYVLTVSKLNDADSLHAKKIADRAQYALLPSKHNYNAFHKLTISSIKNLCHGYSNHTLSPLSSYLKNILPCHVYFFYHLDFIEKTLSDCFIDAPLSIREALSNRTMVITDGEFNYPLILARIPALVLWTNSSLKTVLNHEIEVITQKLPLCRPLFHALKTHYHDAGWTLVDGQMRYTYDGLTRAFDYANLLDDIISARQQRRISDYLIHFRVSDLDTSSSFPTVTVRSLVHLKARPQSLSNIQNGYAIASAKEGFGTQTPVDAKENNSPRAFSLWLNRAQRHLFRHTYRARVVFEPSKKAAFSIVGEQIATLALFPGLVKGVFESLGLEAPKSVRLIAHNEDVLTIGHDTASWVDINIINERATTLFRLIANDGADPLSLFEQVMLPEIGVGSFQLKVVPEVFFELHDAAMNQKHSMPPGHDHYLLGLAFECIHEWGLAVVEFQKALRFDSNDPDILHGLGCALMEVGHVKESLPFLKRAFDMMPEDPEVANNWGQSNMRCGRLEDAITAFERAVKLSPGSADYLKNLGDGYLQAARPTDALATLNKAVRCDPHSAYAHASLAHLHLASGDEELAKKHALLAYKENPIDANIANLLWRLTLGKNSKS